MTTATHSLGISRPSGTVDEHEPAVVGVVGEPGPGRQLHVFDDITINEVATAAGVSKVTVFAHFDRKEDPLLDRLPGAVETVRTAIRERPEGTTLVEAIRN